MTQPKLTLSGISKSFPGVRALHDVALELYAGEVTALIGENGAGKSTLVKVLTGIYQPDAGEITLDGKPVSLSSAHKAFELGITAIHQETVLFDDLSVAENIYLGHAPRTRFRTIDWPKMRADAVALLKDMGAGHIDAEARLRDLSIVNKHLVAVARAMSIDAEVVIMDEPTAALGVKESRRVLELILDVKKRGLPIVLISHNMPHVFEVADRIHIHRLGKRLCVINPKDYTMSDAVAFMTGAKTPPAELLAA